MVTERLGWLARMVAAATQSRIDHIWTDQAVSSINGRRGHAYVAMERAYGKPAWPPEGLYASDRVRRMAEELAGRTLRSAARQIGILEAVLPVFLPIELWESLPVEERTKRSLPWPSGTTGVERRNLVRAVRKFEARNGHLPEGAYEVVGKPEFAAGYLTCPLDAADDQAVRLAGRHLSIQLPIKERPGKGDWTWHDLELILPGFAWRREDVKAVRFASSCAR